VTASEPRRLRALLSVSDKSGVVDFARGLIEQGFELLSTGGTAKALRDAGLTVTDVSTVTGFPEIMDGRVKTLHPKIHGGLLARRHVDEAVAAEHGIELIDLLVVNLYPFQRVTARADSSFDDAIENIDIGGPAMLRAAAKNHGRVTVLVDPADYAPVLATLHAGADDATLRRRLATKAFAHTAMYDAAISGYLAGGADGSLPETLVLAARRLAELRYGENPHQYAATYTLGASDTGIVIGARQLQGKELSYNNIADADAAAQCVKGFSAATCVIVKHANPCGVASADDIGSAYRSAYACDPTSAFGGIIAFNRPLDGETAATIIDRQFAEVVTAPEITAEARAALAGKPNVRVLELGAIDAPKPALEIKTIEGGLLVQTRDLGTWSDCTVRVATRREPTSAQWRDLEFAWAVAKHVKSNAIVYAGDQRTLGIGAGQMSRVDSARIAALKAAEAGLSLDGAVMASDAFFPFRDGIDTAAERGVRAIVQPGGALRDEEIIAAADELGIAMVFTGMRHFRH
jgi:phosphoribosylaminoimidazolecarboxamide formyltransferase / IMP cyclohydrolase